MDSKDRLEKVEQLSGNETGEQGSKKVNSDSKIDIFTGDGSERPGQKETEPVSTSESTSGDEFEGSGKQETKSDLASDRSSENASKEQEGNETKPDSNKGNPQVRRRNYGAKGKFSLVIAIGISLFLGIGYIYVKPNNLKLNNNKLDLVPERKAFPIPKGESITFGSFIVPFKENRRFTYISLSIVISLPNNEVRNEMTRKRDRIRGILYDMFIEEVNRDDRIPLIDHLKKSIIRTVNGVLSVGVVKEVFVTQFLAV